MARERHVWATGGGSKIKTMADVFDQGSRRALLFGATEVGGSGFVDVAIASRLLGIASEYVVGYSGSRQYALAAMRAPLAELEEGRARRAETEARMEKTAETVRRPG